MASDPDLDLVTHLATQGIGTAATNLFRGPVRDATGVPDASVFCLLAGGPAPESFVDGGASADYRRSSVQINTRSAPDDYNGGLAKAKAASAAAHKASLAGYVDVRVRESEPLYLGRDEKARHRFSSNVTMEHRQ
jgi:hypothetical protein